MNESENRYLANLRSVLFTRYAFSDCKKRVFRCCSAFAQVRSGLWRWQESENRDLVKTGGAEFAGFAFSDSSAWLEISLGL